MFIMLPDSEPFPIQDFSTILRTIRSPILLLFFDVFRWVHVVCALYVPGVAFGDIDKLRPVTLTEMNYSKYGAKASSLFAH